MDKMKVKKTTGKEKNLGDKNRDRSDMAKLSQKWLELLVPFSYQYNLKFSGSELSRKTRIPKRSISRYLTSLVRENILKFEEKGNNKFYYLDFSENKTKLVLRLVEDYKAFKLSQNNVLWKDINQLMDFGTIVVFGSQVKGYSNKSSDIDLVVFAKKSEKLKKVLRNLSRVQAQVILFDSFDKLVFEKDVLALEILKNHVIFGDADEFLNLCWRVYGE